MLIELIFDTRVIFRVLYVVLIKHSHFLRINTALTNNK